MLNPLADPCLHPFLVAATDTIGGSGGSGGVDCGEASAVYDGMERASYVEHGLATAFDAAPFIPHR